MNRQSAWLALALLLMVVLACSVGKKSTNVSTNGNATEGGSSNATSTGTIEKMQMAKDDGKGAPGDEANVFSPGDRTIHCVLKLAAANAGTKIRFSWFIVDAGGSKDEKIKDIDYTTGALENIVHGNLTLPKDWPTGKYRVDVFVNGNLEKTARYSVI